MVKLPVEAEALVTLIDRAFGHETPGGKPVERQVMATMPVKPPLGVTVTVDVPLLPAVTVAFAALKVNEPVVADVTTTVAFPAPDEAEPV